MPEYSCRIFDVSSVDGDDESAQRAARRELLEETGYEASTYEKIGSCFPQPAVLTNECVFYLARDAVPVKTQELDLDTFRAFF